MKPTNNGTTHDRQEQEREASQIKREIKRAESLSLDDRIKRMKEIGWGMN